MDVRIERTHIPDLLIVHHQVFDDARGFFMEVYRQDVFEAAGLPSGFVQLNHSRSAHNVVRGLHFQWDPQMGKLMRVTAGIAYLVAVDIRMGSPMFGRWHGEEVSAENRRQIWAPAGFARGFCVLSEFAEIQYLCTGIYNSKGESGILWSDPEIGIDWPVTNPQISSKDREAQTLSQWCACQQAKHFVYP